MAEPSNRAGSLADQLALERTELASERTMLAWLRTGLGAGIAGTTLLRFGGAEAWDRPVAYGLMTVGALAIALGWWRRRQAVRRYAAWGGEVRRLPPT